MMTQTLAIFYGAYRRLNARKMFWIVLALSLLVVGAMACVGFGADGVSVLGWTIMSQVTTDNVSPAVFYKYYVFQMLGIDIWLSWAACILAIISTAGIFPDFISTGSIDLVLCKPIGRVRLFLTQYAAGLLFVVIQVTLFSLGSFLVIGVRAGAWDPDVFMAIPLVVCFFSYLFSVCALLGVLTRSTVAALLLTLLFWFLLFALHTADSNITVRAIMTEQQADRLEQRISELKAEPGPRTAPARDEPPGDPDDWHDDDFGQDIPTMEQRLSELRDNVKSIREVQDILVRIKTFLPKTTETVEMLQRCLIGEDELPMPGEREYGRRVMAERRDRSVAWVVGTSVCFEVVMLALGAWVFRRRDF